MSGADVLGQRLLSAFRSIFVPDPKDMKSRVAKTSEEDPRPTPPEERLRGGGDTYESKNEDYGDSWRKVGEILHLLADGETVELETAEDHISYGLFTRRLDKFARAYHGEFIDDDPNHEPIGDAHEDEMVYAAMSATNLEEANASN